MVTYEVWSRRHLWGQRIQAPTPCGAAWAALEHLPGRARHVRWIQDQGKGTFRLVGRHGSTQGRVYVRVKVPRWARRPAGISWRKWLARWTS